ncbi:MAG: TonB-dependent receptor domain-containing protein, partial [Chitinophagales bacterium]
MRTSFFVLLFILITGNLIAQFPQGGKPGGFNSKQFNVGHFYGKIVDGKTNKAVEYATVQLFHFGFDTVSKKQKNMLVAGALTETNGEFSLENLPVMGDFTLKVTAIGYDSMVQKVSFDIDFKSIQQGNYQKALGGVDKDLGNIKINPLAIQLSEVTVTADQPIFKLELDKKVYTPDKDPSNAGTTADEVLKKVPSVQVDLDGNVTLRNATPQILVDGRPTTLTMDQIPSDVIDKIEVITNPSAKFDASGGQAGIINIVMKKNRRIGYNGDVRAGIDERGKFNLGGDINVRQGKVNVFANANFSQRKSIFYNTTDRNNLFGVPLTNLSQIDTPINTGQFGFASLGADYFMNNRNTLSLSGTFVRGHNTSDDVLHLTTDSLFDTGTSTSYSDRTTTNTRDFHNLGSALSFKHIFPKDGHDLTADVNYNQSTNNYGGIFLTQFYDENHSQIGMLQQQKQTGSGSNKFLTIQSDYENPLTDNMKLEAGVRGALRYIVATNHVFLLDDSSGDFIEIPDINNYTYSDQVYAAYGTFSDKVNKFQYEAGLRVESSFYTGKLTDVDTSFSNNFPLSLFPSGFVTYQLTNNSDLQLNYTRRIDRPSFFQLMPFTDYTDSLNLQRGNPDLKPQFTNTIEFSYEKNFDKNNSLLASAYFKNTTQLITRYQELFYDSTLGKQVIINTYENANSSYLYGLEFTGTNSIKKWLTITSNLNLYESYINGENIESGLSNSQFTWFAKVNAAFKLPKNFTIQVNGDYQSKSSVPQGGSSGFGGGGSRGMGGGGGGFFGTPPSTVQGYVKPV